MKVNKLIVADRVSFSLLVHVLFNGLLLRKNLDILFLDRDPKRSLLLVICNWVGSVRFCQTDLADCSDVCAASPFWEREKYLLAEYAKVEPVIRDALQRIKLAETVNWDNFGQFIARYVLHRRGENIAKSILASDMLAKKPEIDRIFLDANILSQQLREKYPTQVKILSAGLGIELTSMVLCKYVLQMFGGRSSRLSKSATKTACSSRKRVAIQYVHGFTNSGWGTDWDWFDTSGLVPKDVLYLVENDKKLRRADIKVAEKKGIRVEIIGKNFRGGGIILLRPEVSWVVVLKCIKACFLSGKEEMLALNILLTYLMIFHKWRNIFSSLNVFGYVNVGDANFDAIPKMHALEALGGVNLSYEFSATGFQSYFDACPTGRHQYLMWGDLSKRILENSATLLPYRLGAKYMPFAGNMKLHMQHKLTVEQEKVVSRVRQLSYEKVVLIADSTPTQLKLTSTRNIDDFYEAVCPLIADYPNVLFVVKPQKPSALSQQTRNLIIGSQKNKNLIFLDKPLGLTHFLFPVVDLVVGMPIYASIFFEALAAGKNAICFDQSSFPHVAREFHTKDSLVSSDIDLRNSFRKAMSGELSLDVIKSHIEPYGDLKGHIRFGSYLWYWSECLNEFGCADVALPHVIDRYRQAWPIPKLE